MYVPNCNEKLRHYFLIFAFIAYLHPD